MSEQKLNLVQFSACGVTQLRARATKIVQSQSSEAQLSSLVSAL
jgi:hypothetical protein